LSTKNITEKKSSNKILDNINGEKLSEISKNIININNVVNNIKNININLITNNPSTSSIYNTLNNINKFKQMTSNSNKSITDLMTQNNTNGGYRRMSIPLEKPSQPSLLPKNFVIEKNVKENNFIQPNNLIGLLNNKSEQFEDENEITLKKSNSVKASLRNKDKEVSPAGKIVLKGLSKLNLFGSANIDMANTIKTNEKER